MSAATWWGYLPGFLHPDYIGALGNELPDHRFFFGLAHSLAYALVLPIMYGSGLSAVMILLLIQELCFMGFTTNLQRLCACSSCLGLRLPRGGSGPRTLQSGLSEDVATPERDPATDCHSVAWSSDRGERE